MRKQGCEPAATGLFWMPFRPRPSQSATPIKLLPPQRSCVPLSTKWPCCLFLAFLASKMLSALLQSRYRISTGSEIMQPSIGGTTQTQKEEKRRGKLKIFLGAAPGVGKTYAMLLSGRAQAASGADVVVGVVEIHGRAEIEALLKGLEIIPRRKIEYRGSVLEEMDLDAVLARKPKLVLVDELAHTNVPGSRHQKRYQDVLELLANGIDVYTTVNVQHLESR